MSATTGQPPSVKDVFYTAVGLAVLATQRLQVKRREVQEQLPPQVKSAASATASQVDARRREVQKQVEPAVREAAGRLRDVAGVIDQRVDPVLDQVQERLPDTGAGLMRQARGVAKGARDAVLDRAARPAGDQRADR